MRVLENKTDDILNESQYVWKMVCLKRSKAQPFKSTIYEIMLHTKLRPLVI